MTNRSSSTAQSVSSPHGGGIIPPEDNRLIQSFVLTLEAENLSPATVRVYRHAVTQMATYLRGTMGVTAPLNEISTEHIREVMGHLLQSRAPATAGLFLAAFKRFFKWLLAEGERRDDPTERIRQPKVPMKETETLSQADIKALLAACGRDKTKRGFRDAAILMVLLDTGLRANELCSATLADLDLNARTLTVKLGKGRKPRTVGVSAKTCVAIDRYLRKARADAEETEPLFTGRTGERLGVSGLQTLIQSRADEAGLKKRVWPHKLRHTAATMLADAGMQEGELRHIMGWSPNSGMVFRYTQSTLSKRARTAQSKAGVMDKLLG